MIEILLSLAEPIDRIDCRGTMLLVNGPMIVLALNAYIACVVQQLKEALKEAEAALESFRRLYRVPGTI